MLLDRGAQVNALDGCWSTPLHYAYNNGDDAMVRLLISRDANPEAQNIYGQKPSISREQKLPGRGIQTLPALIHDSGGV